MDLDIRLLGPFEVITGGSRVNLGGVKPSLVLALLSLNVGRVVSTDRIIEAVWGEAVSDNALSILQVYASKLRRTIEGVGLDGRKALLAQRPGYVLDIEPSWVDSARFGAFAASGRLASARGEHATAIGLFTAALELWRGGALANFSDNAAMVDDIQRLESDRAEVAYARLDCMIMSSRHTEVISEIEAELSRTPLREQLWGLLMLALYRSSRQADALTAFRRARALLNEELGIDPGPELRRLESAILRHDASLDVRSRPKPSVDVTVRAFGARVAPAAWLEFADSRRVPVQGDRMTIGRSSEADVTIDDPKASRMHAAIKWLPSGYRIVDLNSTNGTRVNEVEISELGVTSGDTISVGSTHMVFVQGSGAED